MPAPLLGRAVERGEAGTVLFLTIATHSITKTPAKEAPLVGRRSGPFCLLGYLSGEQRSEPRTVEQLFVNGPSIPLATRNATRKCPLKPRPSGPSDHTGRCR